MVGLPSAAKSSDASEIERRAVKSTTQPAAVLSA
jgi:hypothetical protein